MRTRWYSGTSDITTYYLEELLGTKTPLLYTNAAKDATFSIYIKPYQQKKWDTGKIIECYRRYMDFVVDKPPTQKEFLLNMEAKIVDEEFLGDTNLLLRPEETYNPQVAYELVKNQLIEKL